MLAVGSPPEVVEPLQNVVMQTPGEAVLKCDITPGDPVADVHWFKDSKELYKGRKYSMSYVNDVALLTIAEPTVKDSGSYRCEAVNKLGTVETDCSLVVQGTVHILLSNNQT